MALNVRQGPGLAYPVIGQAAAGGLGGLFRHPVDTDDVAVDLLGHRLLLVGGRGDAGVHGGAFRWRV